MRTLILTTGTSYRWPVIAPFILSLRESGFTGDVVMLVEDKWLHPEDYAHFLRQGIETYSIYPWLSRIPERIRRFRFKPLLWPIHRMIPALALVGPRRLSSMFATWFHPIMSARLFFYCDLLATRGSQYQQIILSDLRDVVFQSNPDEWRSDATLNVFLESDRHVIGAQSENAQWIRRLYGGTMLNALALKRVSCAGIMHGSTAAMVHYLKAMTRELARLTTLIGGINGYDQGVHNYLLHTATFPGIRIWENGDGLVINLHGETLGASLIDADGTVRNSHGKLIPMVHQYDRHPALCEIITRKFRSDLRSSRPTQ